MNKKCIQLSHVSHAQLSFMPFNRDYIKVLQGHLLEVENVGAGQGLQLLVLLPDGLSTHAAVELQFFHTLQELHHLLPQLLLLLLTAVDVLHQAVNLQ